LFIQLSLWRLCWEVKKEQHLIRSGQTL